MKKARSIGVLALAIWIMHAATPLVVAQRAQAPAAPLPEATTLVTIHVNNVPPQQAIEEMSKVTGYNIIANGISRNASPVTLNHDNQPFWVVMQDLLAQTRLRFEPGAGSGSEMRLYAGSSGGQPLPQFQAGAFLIIAQHATRTHHVNLADPQRVNSSRSFQFQGLVDPAVSIFRNSYQLQVTEATDEKGNSLVVPDQTVNTTTPNNSFGFEFQAPLMYQPDHGNTLKTLKGNLVVQIIAKEELWEIPNLPDAVDTTKEVGDIKFTYKGMSQLNPTTYSIRIDAEIGPNVSRRTADTPALDSSTLRRSVVIMDSLEQSLPIRGYSSRSNGPNLREYTLTVFLSGDPNDPGSLPHKMEMRIPVELGEVTIPIEFNDLPLP